MSSPPAAGTIRISRHMMCTPLGTRLFFRCHSNHEARVPNAANWSATSHATMNARCGFVLSPAWNPVSLYVSTSGRIIAIANNTPMDPNSIQDIDLYEAYMLGSLGPSCVTGETAKRTLWSSGIAAPGFVLKVPRPCFPASMFDLLIFNSSNGSIDNCSALLRLPEYWSAQSVAAVVAADHP